MPRLTIKSGAAIESFELRPGSNRLGRAPATDFPIDHLTVSSIHCEIICEEGSVFVRDCGSTNGTFVDGHSVKESRLLPDQTLRLGNVEMVLESLPAIVAIPRMDFREPPPPGPMADGSIPCLNHPAVRARRKCAQCQKSFCGPCIHTLRRVGGKVLKLCPLCSGTCEIIPWKDDPQPRKKSFLASLKSLKKTLRLTRKGHS